MDNLLKRNCYVDGLSSLLAETINQNVIVTQVKRAKQSAKSLMTTKPIKNKGFGLNRRVCVYLRCPQNLWDFALNKEKKKQNKKISLRAWRKVNASLLPYFS